MDTNSNYASLIEESFTVIYLQTFYLLSTDFMFTNSSILNLDNSLKDKK